MSSAIAILPSLGAELILTKRPIPKPGSNQILLKHKAVAINPVDWKRQLTGYFINSYPTVLGSDVCGTVEALGKGVTQFKVGDRILGYQARDPHEGAFQEYSILDMTFATKMPDFMSFEEGSVFPMAVATAGAGFFVDLDLPRFPRKVTGGILVWGGSSSCGSVGVQMAKLSGFTVFSTASTKHHKLVTDLGAQYVFDYKSLDVVEKIVSAANAEGIEIKIMYDTAVSGGSFNLAFKILEAFGGGRYVGLLSVPQETTVPDGITATRTTAGKIRDDEALRRWLYNEWLQQALERKDLIPSPSIQLVEGSLGSIQKAMDMNKAGVSGVKVVVPIL